MWATGPVLVLTYSVTISQVLHPTAYNLQECPQCNYDALLEVTGTGAFQKWTVQLGARDHGASARVLLFNFNLHVEKPLLAQKLR